MAFKPIVVEKEIKGRVFKAQFNGISAYLDARSETSGNERKAAEYIFENVIVDPVIGDMDDFFGRDTELFAEVLAFGGGVLAGEDEYFPEAEEKGTKGDSKK